MTGDDMTGDDHGEHRYTVRCAWSGSTRSGYDAYPRTHKGSAPPAGLELELTSDPAFGGDPRLYNPEQLVVLAAASCQLLSFLAVASVARVDVRGYHDEAVGVMPESERPMSITSIHLRPTITVAEGPTVARVRHLVEVAHRECFVANSLRTEIEVTPRIIIGDSPPR